ncbi:MAG: hypothetical protein ABSB42_04600 [Tepidisphaeraceae bacterium]|jgi:hypothetical protein
MADESEANSNDGIKELSMARTKPPTEYFMMAQLADSAGSGQVEQRSLTSSPLPPENTGNVIRPIGEGVNVNPPPPDSFKPIVTPAPPPDKK